MKYTGPERRRERELRPGWLVLLDWSIVACGIALIASLVL